jgi:hypothetical protein
VSEYQRVPQNEALYVKIAKILSQDSDLVARYRAALARVPKNLDLDDRSVKHEAIDAVQALGDEIDRTVRKLEPNISHRDCLRAADYFVDWIFGRRKLV